VLPGIVLYVLSVMSLSRLSASPAQAYFLFALVGVSGAMCGVIPFNKVVAATFHARRGLMLGLVIGGAGTIGTAITIPIARFLIVSYGWREAYVIMGIAIFVLAFPIVFLFLREPVHASSSVVTGLSEAASPAPGVSVREALVTKSFWAILASMLLISLAGYAFRTHSFAWLTDRRFSSALATSVISLVALCGFLGQVCSGALLDRVQTPKIAIPFFAATILGLGVMTYAQNSYLLLASAVVFGAGLGTETAVLPYFVSRYFGFRAFSEIMSYIGSAIAIGSAAGVVLMGVVFDHFGNYEVGLATCEAALILGTLAIALLGPYTHSIGGPRLDPNPPESEATLGSPPAGARAGARA